MYIIISEELEDTKGVIWIHKSKKNRLGKRKSAKTTIYKTYT